MNEAELPAGRSAATKVRSSYDTVAAAYEAAIGDELTAKPWDRALVQGFAGLASAGKIADVGCGPGHVTTFLASLGVDVIGLDLSVEMVRLARRRASHLTFVVASMLALPTADASWSGVAALYSVIHLGPAERAAAFAEFARVTRPGGWLLVSFHVDSPECAVGEVSHLTNWFGHQVDLNGYFLDPEEVGRDVEEVGFSVASTVVRAPWPDVEFPSRRCYLLARRG